jgi:uncharacterized protein
MTQQEIIRATENFVKEQLAGAEGGHDYWHIIRVRNNAFRIATGEKVNTLVVELAALLHDIADSKFHGGDDEIGPQRAESFLRSIHVSEGVIQHVIQIIRNISFKGGHKHSEFASPELAVVQDADRLDALGAIGIARTFNFGGYKNREIYDPNIAPNLNMSKEEYKHSTAPTLNHFYEKLLLLKDLMNTPTGKTLAEERHRYMELYLDQFYKEWEGSC